jgi:hypothetical protein
MNLTSNFLKFRFSIAVIWQGALLLFHTVSCSTTEYPNAKYLFEYSLFTIHLQIFEYAFQLYGLFNTEHEINAN